MASQLNELQTALENERAMRVVAEKMQTDLVDTKSLIESELKRLEAQVEQAASTHDDLDRQLEEAKIGQVRGEGD